MTYRSEGAPFLFSILIALFLLLTPLAASAGLFSFVAGLFSGSDGAENQTASAANSQNINLLKAALNSNPNAARGGGDITIVGDAALLPETGPAGTIADIESQEPTSGTISIYVVHPGDSLSEIADMFGVSVNTIVWANDLKNSVITEGQTLVILPISGVRHTVKSGDTLESIAKKYKADIEEIKQFNDISGVLASGDTIIIPDGEIPLSQSRYTHSTKTTAGYYLRPLKGGQKTQGIHGYNAVDIAAEVGTPIYASANGKVLVSRSIGWNGGYGNYVVIAHDNGTQTLYAHMSKNVAGSGEFVIQGQVIGYVGSTGKSTGPHLHFEIRGARNPF